MLIDSEILSFVSQRYKAGFQITDIVSELTEKGYSQEEILNILELSEADPTPYKADFEAICTRNVHNNFKSMGLKGVQLYVYDNFLDPKFCSELSGALCPRIISSAEAARVANTPLADADPSIFSELAEIDKNLTLLLEVYAKLPAVCAEFMVLNVLDPLESKSYDVELRPKKSSDPAFERANKPTWSFFVFLTDNSDGGEVIFKDLDLAVSPKTGFSVLFNRVDAEGSSVPQLKQAEGPLQYTTRYVLRKDYRTFPIV